MNVHLLNSNASGVTWRKRLPNYYYYHYFIKSSFSKHITKIIDCFHKQVDKNVWKTSKNKLELNLIHLETNKPYKYNILVLPILSLVRST